MPSPDAPQAPSSAIEGVVVLGMHRSGTSVATRLLNLLGLHTCVPGDLLGPMRGNPTGLWESASMVEANDGLLAAAGHAWWCPPRPGAMRPPDELALSGLAASFRAVHPRTPWIWKDPRLAMTLPVWRAALGDVMAVVVMLRSPLEVATSMRGRDGFALPFGVAIWERYNRSIVSGIGGLRAWVTSYEELMDDPSAWLAAASTCLSSWGLPAGAPDPGTIDSFLDPSLRHGEDALDPDVGPFPEAQSLHAQLSRLRGLHAAFREPSLPVEAPWVTAQLCAVGRRQQTPVPEPVEQAATVVVGAAAGDVADLVAGVPDWCEVVVVNDAPDEPDQAGEELDGRAVTRVAVSAGAPTGAARVAALAQASTDIVVLLGPHAVLHPGTYESLLAGLAAGHAAVCPRVATADGGTGAGLTLGEGMTPTWLPVRGPVAEVPVVADTCFVLDRRALAGDVGFDQSIVMAQASTTDLCLALWRAGRSCAAVATGPRASVARVGQTATPEVVAADHVRIADRHFAGDELAAAVKGMTRRPGFGAGAARVLTATQSLAGRAGTPGLGRRLGARLTPVADAVTEAERSGSGAQLPTVSVVVAARDEGDELGATVEALRAELRPGDEVVIVDDCSSDGSAEGLGAGVTVVRPPSRLGVARARALGASRTTGELLVFSDAHVRPEPGWRRGLSAAAGHPAVGAAGPALVPFGKPDAVAGGLTYTARTWDVRWLMNPTGIVDVPAVCGCFLVVRRALFEELGGFDTGMGTYGSEDLELCLRLWRAGYRCVVVSSARVAHRFHYGSRDDVDMREHLFGSLRFWSTHLEGPDLAEAVGRAAGDLSFAAAGARVLHTDVAARREAVRGASVASATAVLDRLCPEIASARGTALRSATPRRPPRRDVSPVGHHLVFVGGLHRSGTTLVASCIAAHPDASGFAGTGVPKDEGQHLQDVLPTARAHGGPGRFASDPAAHLTEESPLATAANAERLFAEWAPYWDLTKTVLVEKSPPTLVRARLMQALFPGARFVMVSRHPVPVALSTRRWSPEMSLEDLVEHWCRGWEVFSEDEPHLARATVVRYEDLVADPAATLASLGEFCGLDGLAPVAGIDREQSARAASEWEETLAAAGGAELLARLTDRFAARVGAFGYDVGRVGPAY